MSTAGLANWGPPVPQAFLRPRLGWRELGHLLRNLLTDSGFGVRELRLLAKTLRSRSLPGAPSGSPCRALPNWSPAAS